MGLLGYIYKRVLNEAKASEDKINRAIDKHSLIMIRYNTHGEHVAMANRLCGVFAYGTTKKGNPCIRVFEYEGDTTTFVPGWKLIRIDRIINWYDTKRSFSEPPQLFNPEGDNSMAMVYKIARFDNEPYTTQSQQPKQQTNIRREPQQPKIKPTTSTVPTPTAKPKDRRGLSTQYADKPLRKTDTENAMDYLRKQLENPEKIDLSKIGQRTSGTNKTPNVIQATPVAQQPIERQGVSPQYADKPLKKTDTENAMEYLRKQLENPETIDLSSVPKK